MIMEDCSYSDVATQIYHKKRTKESFSEVEVILLMLQVSAALNFSHEKKVIHGDLKPKNLLIKSDGSVKVVNFGK